MNIYSLGYGTCEESEYWQYWHEQAFSQERFQAIMQECLLAAYTEIRTGFKVDDFGCPPNQSFQRVMSSPEFHQELVKRGFVKVEFKQVYSVFGWSDVEDIGDWESYSDDVTRQAQEFVVEGVKKVEEGRQFIKNILSTPKGERVSGCAFCCMPDGKHEWNCPYDPIETQ